jgi:hypothetical protein
MLVQAVMRACTEHMRALQQNIMEGTLPDTASDIYGLMLEREGSVPRYSLAVLGQSAGSGGGQDDIDASRQLPQHALDAAVCGRRGERIAHLRYLHAPGTQVCAPCMSQQALDAMP